MTYISIHALREEGDPRLHRDTANASNFYPRPPRGGRPKFDERNGTFQEISIHALREEGDLIGVLHAPEPQISIHALREEGDPHIVVGQLGFVQFLSTPSARRATRQAASILSAA